MEVRKTLLIAPTRDTHENWLLNNPVLPEGVLAIVKGRLSEESLEFVIGDGVTAYDELVKSGQSIATVVEQVIKDSGLDVDQAAVTEIVEQILASSDYITETGVTELVTQILANNNYITENAVTEYVTQTLTAYVAAKIMTSVPAADDLNEGEVAFVVES